MDAYSCGGESDNGSIINKPSNIGDGDDGDDINQPSGSGGSGHDEED